MGKKGSKNVLETVYTNLADLKKTYLRTPYRVKGGKAISKVS